MPRLDRGIQYTAALVLHTDLNWRSGILGRPVKPGDDKGGIKKAGAGPAVL
jgi:hypothetical protein